MRCFFLGRHMGRRRKRRSAGATMAAEAASSSPRPKPPRTFAGVTALTKFVPGQSFSLTVLLRYDKQNRCGLGSQSQLAAEPGPQKICYGQKGWLFLVDPPAENDKEGVASRCISYYSVTIRAIIGRLDEEHPARACGRTDRGQLCYRSLRHSCKVLANEELGDFALAIYLSFFLPLVVGIMRYGHLPTERQQHNYGEREPPKHGEKAHAWHLSR